MHPSASLYIILCLSIVLHRTLAPSLQSGYYNYGLLGPAEWPILIPAVPPGGTNMCGGQSQSPINILTACTIYQQYPPFQYSTAYSVDNLFIITNDTVKVAATLASMVNGAPPNTSAYQLTGGGLNETFFLVSFHIHWGLNYKQGSEHQVNGQKYGGEIHFVHSNAAGTRLAVLGVFMDVAAPVAGRRKRSVDSKLDNVFRQIRDISSDQDIVDREKRRVVQADPNTAADWAPFFAASVQAANRATDGSNQITVQLSSMISATSTDFWRYSGSLTTPLCTENVIWTVFKQPIPFADEQIVKLRAGVQAKTFRPPQLLYGRTVFRNFLTETLPTINDFLCCPTNSSSSSGSNTTATTAATTRALGAPTVAINLFAYIATLTVLLFNIH